MKLQLILENMSKNFPCTECEYKATWKGHLQTHIKAIHKGETFQCPDCDYRATRKGHLQTHIKSIHRGETFPCPECDYKATKKVVFGDTSKQFIMVKNVIKVKHFNVQTVITKQHGKTIFRDTSNQYTKVKHFNFQDAMHNSKLK